MAELTRRQVVKGLLALGAVGPYWSAFASDTTRITAPTLTIADPDHPTLEVFTALSSLVTLRSQLDAATAQKMCAVFMQEPWGPQNISSTYSALKQALVGGKVNVAPLDKDQQWFFTHLLTTWYLGVYYHEQRPTQRITYKNALMFESVREWLPIPLLEGTGFGNWQDPPEKKS